MLPAVPAFRVRAEIRFHLQDVYCPSCQQTKCNMNLYTGPTLLYIGHFYFFNPIDHS